MRAATERKKGCVKRRREGRGPSYNAPLVHCPDEVRKQGERAREYPVHLLASTSFRCLFLTRACPAASLRLLRPRCTLHRGDKERDGEGKETTKRRGQERREGGEGGGGHGGEEGGAVGKRIPACTTRYTTCQEF